MPTWKFKDQVILITGGAGGLGNELCQAFARLGAKVYACDQDESKVQQLRAIFDNREFASGPCHVTQVDVRSVREVHDWVQFVIEKEGRADVLVNAAGVCPMAKIPEVTEEIWDEVVDVNLKGTFFASQAVAEVMKSQGYGRIINVGSVGGYTGGAIASPAYCAAKAGMVALAKSFANALSPFGVCANTVSPGPFDTEMIADFPNETMEKIISVTPNRRVGKPEDVVQAILFLADASSLHITGATLDINGGLYMR